MPGLQTSPGLCALLGFVACVAGLADGDMTAGAITPMDWDNPQGAA